LKLYDIFLKFLSKPLQGLQEVLTARSLSNSNLKNAKTIAEDQLLQLEGKLTAEMQAKDSLSVLTSTLKSELKKVKTSLAEALEVSAIIIYHRLGEKLHIILILS
jgi:hypothetical protein